jgi:hypothetical protein
MNVSHITEKSQVPPNLGDKSKGELARIIKIAYDPNTNGIARNAGNCIHSSI